jgi:hypothetical protein
LRADVSVHRMNTSAQDEVSYTDRRTNALVRVAVSLALVGSHALPATAAQNTAALATADQQAVEALATTIFATPAVKEQIARSKQLFLASPVASGDEAKASAARAANEFAFAAVLDAVNGDSARPRIVWAFTAPRQWAGHTVPGSRWGIVNPDNVYRFAPVDGSSKYELTVHPTAPGPVQFSFLIYDSFVGEGGRQDHLDSPIASLRDQDIKTNGDGSFTISIDNTPAEGRANHLQTTPDARVLLIRNTFNQWGTQNPQAATVRRIDGPAVTAPTQEQITQRAVELIKAGTDTILGWETKGFAAQATANTIANPFVRGGGWGFAASGSYRIAQDEALVVTLSPAGARYVGFDLTDPWLVSREHIRATGSLNNGQVAANSDGTYTYVIAARDPGVTNWADTGGAHEGKLLIRWQVVPESAKADGAVREVRLVKLAQLHSVLPAGFKSVGADERRELNKARAAEYAHRYAPLGAATERVASAAK